MAPPDDAGDGVISRARLRCSSRAVQPRQVCVADRAVLVDDLLGPQHRLDRLEDDPHGRDEDDEVEGEQPVAGVPERPDLDERGHDRHHEHEVSGTRISRTGRPRRMSMIAMIDRSARGAGSSCRRAARSACLGAVRARTEGQGQTGGDAMTVATAVPICDRSARRTLTTKETHPVSMVVAANSATMVARIVAPVSRDAEALVEDRATAVDERADTALTEGDGPLQSASVRKPAVAAMSPSASGPSPTAPSIRRTSRRSPCSHLYRRSGADHAVEPGDGAAGDRDEEQRHDCRVPGHVLVEPAPRGSDGRTALRHKDRTDEQLQTVDVSRGWSSTRPGGSTIPA